MPNDRYPQVIALRQVEHRAARVFLLVLVRGPACAGFLNVTPTASSRSMT